MTEPRRFRAFAALLLLAASGLALAHKLRVFAAAEGRLVTGSAYFAGGAAATGARVTVQDGRGQTLATLTPDAAGRFSYPAPGPIDLVVVAQTGDGHRTEWRIPAADLAGAFGSGSGATVAGPGRSADGTAGGPAGDAAPAATSGAGTTASAATPAPQPTGTPAAAGPAAAPDAALEAIIERAVARQVRPLREELAAAQDRAALRDILGGLGYILGLAGLALWWDARRRGPRP